MNVTAGVSDLRVRLLLLVGVRRIGGATISVASGRPWGKSRAVTASGSACGFWFGFAVSAAVAAVPQSGA